MHCIEALEHILKACEDCRWNARIIEFEELPESEKENFSEYIEGTDFILSCQKCKVFYLVPSTMETISNNYKNANNEYQKET